MTGTIATLKLDKGYGFIRPDQGRDIFFHVRDCDKSLDFDATLQERRVEFEVFEEPQRQRRRAVNVRPAN
jgi:cold shock CspA family protein